MHILLVLVVACVIFGFIATTVVSLVVWRIVHGYLAARRQKHLARLADYQSRLRSSVSRMLARANEIDQAARYLSASWSEKTQDRYAKALEGLLLLGDSLIEIDKRFEAKELRQGEQILLRSCRVAIQLSSELDAVQLENSTIEIKSSQDVTASES